MKKGDADQLIRCMKECWWRVALVIAIPLALMAWVFWGSPVTMTLEDGAAAWVQAATVFPSAIMLSTFSVPGLHVMLSCKSSGGISTR